MGGDDTAAVYITSAQLSRIGASCCASVQTQRTLYAALRLVFAISLPFAQLRILLALVMCRTLFRAMA